MPVVIDQNTAMYSLQLYNGVGQEFSVTYPGGQQVTFAFKDGRIVSVIAKSGQDAVDAAWTRATGDRDRIAELVLGMNPKLPHTGPGGRLPYYGYGAGMLRIALGDNWESGGANRSSLEAWFYLSDATVIAGTTTLVKDGRLVIQ